MNTPLVEEVEKRGICRLCHFTPSRNLQHIAAGGVGILSTKALQEDERAVFNATDLSRFDNQTGHICCSVEYPNAWYFDRARAAEVLFQNWVVLLIKPDAIWKTGTLFSPRNAAAGSGAYLKSGIAGFSALFADKIGGSGGQVFTRSPNHLLPCPTDQQAEVLVEDRILMEDILGVAVQDEAQARRERVALRTNGLDPDAFRFVAAPHFFKKYELSNAIRYGLRPSETTLTFMPSNGEPA